VNGVHHEKNRDVFEFDVYYLFLSPSLSLTTMSA